MNKLNFILLIICFLSLSSFTKNDRRYAAKVSIDKVANKKKIKIESLIHYDLDNKRTVFHYTYPEEYYLFTNLLGEAKMYYPNRNEVMIKHAEAFSSNSDALFYFMTENYSDMGLSSMGYQIQETKTEGQMVITDWVPPVITEEGVARIRLVLKDYVPIFSAFYNSEDKVVQKTYYDTYTYFENFYVPTRITEITYTPQGDSLISRKQYSDLHKLRSGEDYLINFEIPSTAKTIKE